MKVIIYKNDGKWYFYFPFRLSALQVPISIDHLKKYEFNYHTKRISTKQVTERVRELVNELNITGAEEIKFSLEYRLDPKGRMDKYL